MAELYIYPKQIEFNIDYMIKIDFKIIFFAYVIENIVDCMISVKKVLRPKMFWRVGLHDPFHQLWSDFSYYSFIFL